MKVVSLVAGTANLMKVAPIHAALCAAGVQHKIIDMGIYQKPGIPELYTELKLPSPFEICQDTDKDFSKFQLSRNLSTQLREALSHLSPDILLVYGDMSGIVEASVVAKQLRIKIAHVEAGLRNYDLEDLEEWNRTITDAFSTWLFTISKTGEQNLLAEGHPANHIHVVGNTVIDCLKQNKSLIDTSSNVTDGLNITEKQFGLVTIHREHNLSSQERLSNIVEAIKRVQNKIPLVFLLYENTKQALKQFNLDNELLVQPNITMLDRLPYREFLGILSRATFVLTDSSGIQDETTFLRIPCFTCLDVTHRSDTVDYGTNQLVGNDPALIESSILIALASKGLYSVTLPEQWDGNAATRIAAILTS